MHPFPLWFDVTEVNGQQTRYFQSPVAWVIPQSMCNGELKTNRKIEEQENIRVVLCPPPERAIATPTREQEKGVWANRERKFERWLPVKPSKRLLIWTFFTKPSPVSPS